MPEGRGRAIVKGPLPGPRRRAPDSARTRRRRWSAGCRLGQGPPHRNDDCSTSRMISSFSAARYLIRLECVAYRPYDSLDDTPVWSDGAANAELDFQSGGFGINVPAVYVSTFGPMRIRERVISHPVDGKNVPHRHHRLWALRRQGTVRRPWRRDGSK